MRFHLAKRKPPELQLWGFISPIQHHLLSAGGSAAFIKLQIYLHKKIPWRSDHGTFLSYFNCQLRLEFTLRSCLLDGYSNCNSHTNHRVVARTDQTHHLNVSRNGGGTCELCVGVHTAKGIGHTVGSRTCCHVIRMQGTSCTTAGSNGEVFLTCFDTLLSCRYLQPDAGNGSGWWSYR